MVETDNVVFERDFKMPTDVNVFLLFRHFLLRGKALSFSYIELESPSLKDDVATVAQSVRAVAKQAEGWVFVSQSRQT